MANKKKGIFYEEGYSDGFADGKGEKEDLRIEVTRIHKLDGTGPTKAFADISVADSFVINGLRVIEGKDGLFVSMPKEEAKDGKWYNTVIPLKRQVKEDIELIVLEAYNA